ncbi:transposase [uncultured Gimesia sp.]|uniref:transposase n=1 Tax=uncultured Gimesia sp. TaxID=1678688 RepID=UPI0030DC7C82|tara:strand:- start:105347 stop:105688 length:342 start_codon:yes stop_codon:yes gene_type:complete
MPRNGKSSSSNLKLSRRVYSEEFKQDAVRVFAQKDYSRAEAARSLGAHVSQIRKRKEKFMAQSPVKKGNETFACKKGSVKQRQGLSTGIRIRCHYKTKSLLPSIPSRSVNELR